MSKPSKSEWEVETNDNSKEYPGIEEKTRMKLRPHPKADTKDEWQIKFSPPKHPKSKKKPPAVDGLHLVYVRRGDPYGKPSIGSSKYFQEAVKVITGSHDYFIGVGNPGNTPTLLILLLSGRRRRHRSFDLVLVKLEQVRGKYSILQGGVIHGHEN